MGEGWTGRMWNGERRPEGVEYLHGGLMVGRASRDQKEGPGQGARSGGWLEQVRRPGLGS